LRNNAGIRAPKKRAHGKSLFKISLSVDFCANISLFKEAPTTHIGENLLGGADAAERKICQKDAGMDILNRL